MLSMKLKMNVPVNVQSCFLVLFLCKVSVCHSCSTLGYSDYTNQVGDGSALTNLQTVQVHNRWQVDCSCGAVSSWSMTTIATGDVTLQVWRPVSGFDYTLVGENTVTVSSVGDNTFSVASANQILVENDDVVGWYSTSTIIDWKQGGGNQGYLLTGTTSSSVGDTVTFSGDTDYKYSVYVIVSNRPNPTLTNLPASETLTKNPAIGVSVYTVTATTSGGVSYTFSVASASPSGAFSISSSTGDVSPDSANTASGIYTLTIRVTDACSNTFDSDLTLTVPQNIAPEIHGLPIVIDVSESAVDETLLYTINVTDSDDNLADVTCTVSSSPSGPFTTKYANDGQGGITTAVYLQAKPGLDYSNTSAYTLTISCTDTYDTTSEYIYVNVIQNNVPTISNLQNVTQITTLTPSNTEIFQIEYYDQEGDQVSFSISCVPTSPCPFTIFSSGGIFLSSSLLGTSTIAYEIDVTISDPYTSSGTHRLSVFITDLNTVPQLSNLPATIQVTEDTTIGTTLFSVTVYDEDGTTSHTFSSTYDPAAGSGLFNLNDTSTSLSGALTLQTALDFYTQDTAYNLTVTVSDGVASSLQSWLYIEIVNVNEAPVLYQSGYQIQSYEAVAGTILQNPNFQVYDPDGDNLTFAFSQEAENDTSGFSINANTGIVSLTIDFDMENTALSSTRTRVWLIVISDPLDLAATATLTVSMLDLNDNVPVLSSTGYSNSTDTTKAVGTIVLTTSASDADFSAENRVLEYAVTGTDIFSVDGSGNIVVASDLGALAETRHTFTLTVRNPGSSSSDTATVNIYVYKGDSSDGFFDKGLNVALFVLGLIAGLLLIAGLIYLAYYLCTRPPPPPPSYRTVRVAPRDTKYRPTPRPNASRTVTPSDISVGQGQWKAWNNDNWF